MTPPDPRTAFAFAALEAALSAKVGDCRIQAARKLFAMALDTLPDDRRAAAAVFEFGWQLMVDQGVAGEFLQRWVEGWVTRAAPPPAEHDWQRRADLA